MDNPFSFDLSCSHQLGASPDSNVFASFSGGQITIEKKIPISVWQLWGKSESSYEHFAYYGWGSCQYGTVTTHDECEAAVKSIAKVAGRTPARGMVVGNWWHVPRGCSSQAGGDWTAHFNTGSGSAPHWTDYRTVCTSTTPTPWYFAPTGATSCPCGRGATGNECEAAARTLTHQYGRVPGRSMTVGAWSWVPLGCSAQAGGDFAAHYNTNSWSHPSSIYRLVCTNNGVAC
jgi:hypothetical protein